MRFIPLGHTELSLCYILPKGSETYPADLKTICVSDLLEVPSGFARGMQFDKKSLEKIVGSNNKPVSVLHLTDLLAQTDDIDLGLEGKSEPEKDTEGQLGVRAIFVF